MDRYRNIFNDRDSASEELERIISNNNFNKDDTILIGISQGGAYIANVLSKKLGFEKDILLSERIYAPNNDNVTIAIITESEDVVIHNKLINSFDIEEDFIYTEARYKYEEDILNLKYKYRDGNKIKDLTNKRVILIDESVESGFTMYASIKSMISLGAKNIYITSPIIDKIAYNNLLTICDGIYYNYKIEDYVSAQYYYKILDDVDIV
ncbi:hypothetical protein MNB_SV-15-1056 [hydrothermal vent metagenome]|uniref:Phosphoribosyltransferase domain-containing protein n=1 Tax=hydrothermal vent metagenome TaxID=652676 RepID=A0A1W1EKS6_9ZZZZ